jgi:hypothetical protein
LGKVDDTVQEVTASQASGEFYTAIHGGGVNGKANKHHKGDPPLPEDYRVIRAQSIAASDAFGQWEKALNQAGHAIIHDKIAVIDSFSDSCVVTMSSHNEGWTIEAFDRQGPSARYSKS